MKPPRSWHQLARLDPRELETLQDELLERRLVQELLVGSTHFRALVHERSIDPRGLGRAGWRSLPLTDRSDLAADSASFLLRPSPAGMRAHWPFGRKLALVAGGRRARNAIERSYVPIVGLTAGEGVLVEVTAHDLDVMGETGGRLLDVAGLGGSGSSIALELHAPHARWIAAYGAPRAGVHVTEGATGRDAPLVWNDDGIVGGELLRTWGPVETRALFAECSPTSGFHTSPDLAYFEVIDPSTGEPRDDGEPGELVYTDLAGHGTIFCRYRTGDHGLLTHEPCPSCGRTVPRLLNVETGSRPQG
ncbi:MAG: hypothetical protein GY711_19785 [bacterium]|nr:hypothetical protein [bacterium]